MRRLTEMQAFQLALTSDGALHVLLVTNETLTLEEKPELMMRVGPRERGEQPAYWTEVARRIGELGVARATGKESSIVAHVDGLMTALQCLRKTF